SYSPQKICLPVPSLRNGAGILWSLLQFARRTRTALSQFIPKLENPHGIEKEIDRKERKEINGSPRRFAAYRSARKRKISLRPLRLSPGRRGDTRAGRRQNHRLGSRQA